MNWTAGRLFSKQWVSKGGVRHGGLRFRRGALYHLLANPIYVGEIRHKKVAYPGQHEPIVERAIWQRVQEALSEKAAHPRGGAIKRTTGLLMGRLFDESGEPLYSCWAKKGALRYRYFVSRKLVKGSNQPEERGWRLPAGRTEEAVTAATLQMLSDRSALASTLKAWGLSAAELKQAVEAIDGKVKSFEQIRTMEESETIIERVELKRDGMQITLNLGAMLPQFPHGGASLRMTRLVPMQLRRRGVETRMVILGEAIAAPRADLPLLRALARGYRWFGDLASGRAASTKQIAARECLSHSYVRHVVPLGLLAPSVVESICAGQQPVILSAERLKDHARLPIEWDAQQRLLSN
jgi:site-specific DNA recombinase